MNKIPTAEEFANKCSHKNLSKEIEPYDLIEFAKLHVEAALKEASNKSNLRHQYGYGHYDDQATKEIIIENEYKKNTYGHGDCGYDIISVNKKSIIDSYPLSNIK